MHIGKNKVSLAYLHHHRHCHPWFHSVDREGRLVLQSQLHKPTKVTMYVFSSNSSNVLLAVDSLFLLFSYPTFSTVTLLSLRGLWKELKKKKEDHARSGKPGSRKENETERKDSKH